MRRVESSFLRRSLALLGITAISVGLSGCLWQHAHPRGLGWDWGWNDRNDRSGYDDGDRHRKQDKHREKHDDRD